MQLIKSTLLATTIIGFASHAIACIDWDIGIDEFEYGTATLDDNGAQVCSYNGYGTNDGYQLNCNAGFSAFVDNSGTQWTYSTPDGSYTGTAQCTVYSTGESSQSDCQGNDGTC